MPITEINNIINGENSRILDYASQDITHEPPTNPLAPKRQRPNEDYDLDDEFGADDMEEDLANDVLGAGSTACGVCFGIGYVGGYNVLYGQRIIADATYGDLRPDRVEINRSTSPNSFIILDASGTLDFNLNIPTAATRFASIRLFNNQDEIYSPHSITVQVNSAWVIPSGRNISLIADGRYRLWRITGNSLLQFTHLEIEVHYTEDLYIDFPRFTENFDPKELTSIAATIIAVPPVTANLPARSVIRDGLYDRLWRINDLQNFSDSLGNVHGYDCNASLIQENDLEGALPKFGRTPSRSGRIPLTALPDRRLLSRG